MNDNIVGWFSTEDGTHIPIKNGQSKKQAIEEKFNSDHNDKKGDSRPNEGKIPKAMYDEWSNAANAEMQAQIDAGKGKISFHEHNAKLGEFEKIDAKLNKIASNNYSKDFSFNENMGKAFSGQLSDGSSLTVSGHHGTSDRAGKGGVAVERKKGVKELDRKSFDNYESAYKYANDIIKEVGKA